MTRLTMTLLSLSLMLSIGCKQSEEPPPQSANVPQKKAKRAKKGPRLEGEIHVARQRKRILPFVMHQPSMDLRVQCLSHRDELAKEDKAVPLCFEEREREVTTEVTTLRIEHREGLRIARAIAYLRDKHEATHFIVDDGGTPYQLLDLALPARRDGVYPADEIRVVSGNEEGLAKLTRALQGVFPKLKITRVEMGNSAPSNPAKPSAAPGATP